MWKLNRLAGLATETSSWLDRTCKTLDDLGYPSTGSGDWVEFLDEVKRIRDLFKGVNPVLDTFRDLSPLLVLINDAETIANLDNLMSGVPGLIEQYEHFTAALERVPLREVIEATQAVSDQIHDALAEDDGFASETAAGLDDLREGRTITLAELGRRHGLDEP